MPPSFVDGAFRISQKKQIRQIVTENQTGEIDKRQTEIDRLAYSRKNEIDPDNYEAFKIGLKKLTKTEKTIFNLYLQGKNAKEIADILNIRKSTPPFHNHNIPEKPGVSSRKQMLRYATLLKQETQHEGRNGSGIFFAGYG